MYTAQKVYYTETWYPAEDKNSKDRFNEVNRTSYVAALFTHVFQCTLNNVQTYKNLASVYYKDGHIKQI